MKKILFILLQIIIFQSINAQTVIRYTNESVYMRESANQRSKALSILPKGTPVTIEEDCDCEWIPVSYNGEIGYIKSQSLDLPRQSKIKAKEQSSYINKLTEQPHKNENDSNGEGTYIVNSSLNVRTSPNTNSQVLGNFYKGQTIYVNHISGNWAEVNVTNSNNKTRTAYIHKNYIRKASNSQANNYKSKQTYSTGNTGGIKYYTNTYGERVQSPTYYNSQPAGATALCRDGTYSFSRNRRGTCSHHGGVARWL